MDAPASKTSTAPNWRSLRFLAGALAGFAVPLLLAECYARVRPPADILQYLGERSPLAGGYRPDAALGADYRSYADFQRENADRLDKMGPLDSPGPTWLWLGNSFVQAPGMLADTAQAALPGVRMFHLGRNEPINLRAAQARLLLENGLRPRRIIFVILPIDAAAVGLHPFSSILVNRNGALTYRVRMPAEPLASLIRHSRLALVAWVRSGRQQTDPSFHATQIDSAPTPSIMADLRAAIHSLGDDSRKYGATVTVLLIPDREQIHGQSRFPVQDAVAGMCRDEGIDCFDARQIFLDAGDKPSLFLPDWHFTPRGNRMLLAGLLAHFDAAKPAGEAAAQ